MYTQGISSAVGQLEHFLNNRNSSARIDRISVQAIRGPGAHTRRPVSIEQQVENERRNIGTFCLSFLHCVHFL